MKNIFSSSDEKITEKAFSQHLLVAIFSILLCIIALCSITYAWFTTNTVSGENVIESSRFALDVQVYDGNGNPLEVTANANGTFQCAFEDIGEYTVVLSMTNDTTATKGYCELTVNGTEIKQTRPISKDASIGVDPFTFTVQITSENTVVVFEAKWGLSSSADVANGDRLVVSNAPASDEALQ